MSMQNQTSARQGSGTSMGAGTTDAVSLLTNDHADVAELFEEDQALVEAEGDEAEKQALAERICALLTAHATIEEEIFYPAAREAGVEADLLDEAEVEHASAKDLIAEIRAMSPDDDLYDAKVRVLGEYIDHHVDEEEGEIFPRCREAKMDLAGLGESIAERKSELLVESLA